MIYVGPLLAALLLGLAFHAWKKKTPINPTSYLVAVLCWFITELAFLVHRLAQH